jgi:hypothetical protein
MGLRDDLCPFSFRNRITDSEMDHNTSLCTGSKATVYWTINTFSP